MRKLLSKPLKYLPPNLKTAAVLSLCLSINFMIAVFIPLDLYLHNPVEFVVGLRILLPALSLFALFGFILLSVFLLMIMSGKVLPSVLAFLLCALFITSIWQAGYIDFSVYLDLMIIITIAALMWFLLVKFLKEKAADILLLLICGFVVASYSQILFFNGSMTLLMGGAASYGTKANENFYIWLGIFLLPIIIWKIIIGKNENIKYEKPLIFIPLVFICMQITGLASVAVSTKLPAGIEAAPMYFSYESALNLSPDDNVVVFLFDRLDIGYMEETLEAHPELYEKLDGFTFYKNNLSEFGSTFPSVTTMLTQNYYTQGSTFEEYWAESWASHTMIDTLRENGFDTNLFLCKLSTFGSFEELEGKTSNIKAGKIKLNINGMIEVVSKLSFGRLSPYIIKNYFLEGLNPSFGNKLFTMYSKDFDNQPSAISVESDLFFYEYIKQNILTANSEKRIFNFIHMNASHTVDDKALTEYGYSYNPESDTMSAGGNYVDAARACFEIADTYFEKMKQIEVYDKSTIIIVSDHGKLGTGAAALLIKPKGASGRLKIDTKAELSNKYFGASILDATGLPHDELGVSYYDIIEGVPAPVRNFYLYTSWWNAQFFAREIALKCTFEITGDANNLENWKIVE